MVGDKLRARTRRFALDARDLCSTLGVDALGRLIQPQPMRAATGVAAGNRAAGRCRSRREFVARLSVVIEEADECEFWLDVLETREYGPPARVARLRQEASELRAIFVASRNTALSRLKRRA